MLILGTGHWCTVSHIVMTLWRSKWAAGKAVRAGLAVRGRISKLIRNRRATQPPAHFHRNLPAAAGWLFFRVACSSRIDLDMLVARALKNSQLTCGERHAYMSGTGHYNP